MTDQPPVLTHDARHERRMNMALAVRDGREPSAVAQAHGVSLQSVRIACREFGVELPPRPGKWTAIRAVKLLLDGATTEEAAAACRVTVSRIGHIRRAAEAVGFQFGKACAS